MSTALCERLLIGIMGSISAAFMPQYIFSLKQNAASELRILLSCSAQQFVSRYTLEVISRGPVLTDQAASSDHAFAVPHIDLVEGIDAFLIMPATANILGKAAHGICDDLISTTIIACQAPVIFAPAMNHAMWDNPCVQQNVQQLRKLGHVVVEPGEGYEVSGQRTGRGALATLDRVVEEIEAAVLAVR